jgi:anti-sigma regulatory factor (Ser/Thr protein kinase)
LRDGQLVDEPSLLELALAVTSKAPQEARKALRSRIPPLDEDSRQVLELLVSELVGNSVRHGGLGPAHRITLNVRAKHDWIRVEVIDRGRRFEPHVPLSKPPMDGSGWGLFALDQTAERWGIIDRPPHRHVWFELRVPVRGEAEPQAPAAGRSPASAPS